MKINLNHLYQFYMTAKEGSIKKSSKVLHITEPTISKQIKDLEEFLDIQLFDRVNNQLKLTEQGRDIMEKSDKVFTAVEELEASIGKSRSGLQNRIKIGAVPLYYPYLMNIFNMNFHEDFAAEASFYSGDEDKISEQLQEKKIDIAVADFPLSISDFYSIKVLDLNLVCVGSRVYEHKKKEDINSILETTPLIEYSGKSKTQEDLAKFCSHHKINPKTRIVVECFESAKTAAIQDRGVAIVPEFSIVNELKSGLLHKLDHFDFVPSSVWMFVLESRTNEPLIKAAIEHASKLEQILIPSIA